jgi:adenylate kinase
MSKKLILIIGAPGAGKTSTTTMLAEKYADKITAYATGELLKAEVEKGTMVGKIISDYFFKGHLVPSAIIMDTILDAVKAAPTDVVVIEGFPRKEKQVKLFGDILFNHQEIELLNVIEIQVSDETAKARFQGTEEMYENEMKHYKETISEVENYYRDHDLLKVVDGENPQDEVISQIESIIQAKI